MCPIIRMDCILIKKNCNLESLYFKFDKLIKGKGDKWLFFIFLSYLTKLQDAFYRFTSIEKNFKINENYFLKTQCKKNTSINYKKISNSLIFKVSEIFDANVIYKDTRASPR